MKYLLLFCTSVLFVNWSIGQGCETIVGFSHNSDGLIGFFESTSQSDCELYSIRWDFGDGTFSTASNPVHTFPSMGEYVVCLEITSTSENQVDFIQSTCQELEIGLQACLLTPEVQLDVVDGLLIGLNVSQTNQSTQITSCSWGFGDGESMQGEEVEHQYLLAGLYEVCVHIEASSGGQSCTFQLCKLIQVSFDVPEFSMEVQEENIEECLYELKASHPLPVEVELVSRVWYLGDETFIGENFILNASDLEPMLVLLKEFYTYRGQQFSKIHEYILTPQCSMITSGVENNHLETAKIRLQLGSIELDSPVTLDKATIFTLDGKMVVHVENIGQLVVPIQPGVHLIRLELNGEIRTQKLVCF
ncbi:MAG: PKD domain-containing protein [Flavobacteriales bacterium]